MQPSRIGLLVRTALFVAGARIQHAGNMRLLQSAMHAKLVSAVYARKPSSRTSSVEGFCVLGACLGSATRLLQERWIRSALVRNLETLCSYLREHAFRELMHMLWQCLIALLWEFAGLGSLPTAISERCAEW
jgi:hypothetical protein